MDLLISQELINIAYDHVIGNKYITLYPRTGITNVAHGNAMGKMKTKFVPCRGTITNGKKNEQH